MKITKNTKLNAIMAGRNDSNIILASQNLNMTFGEYINATASVEPEAVDTLLDILNSQLTQIKSFSSGKYNFKLLEIKSPNLFGSIVVF